MGLVAYKYEFHWLHLGSVSIHVSSKVNFPGTREHISNPLPFPLTAVCCIRIPEPKLQDQTCAVFLFTRILRSNNGA